MAVPAVLYRMWYFSGARMQEAIHNAVVLEEVAKMAYPGRASVHPQVAPAPAGNYWDSIISCKHGANAYYGQNNRISRGYKTDEDGLAPIGVEQLGLQYGAAVTEDIL